VGIDMASPRASAEAYLMGDSCYLLRPRLIDNGKGGTKMDPAGPLRIGPFICGFGAVSGREQNVADQIAQRGSYRLRLPIELLDPNTGDVITLAETDQFEVFARIYDVKWLPPIAALSLFRKVGLEEA
jgi:hypothetical protein